MTRRAVLALLLLASLVGCRGALSRDDAKQTHPDTQIPTSSIPATPAAKSLQTVQLPKDTAPQNPIYAFGSLWVPAHHAAVLLRISPVTGKILARIPAGVGPGSVVASEHSLWVADYQSNALLEVDPVQAKVRRSLTLTNGPCCAAAFAGTTVWIATAGDPGPRRLEGFDTTTGKRIRQLPDLWNPVFLLDRLWATDADGALVQVNPKTGAITKTSAPQGLFLSPHSVSHGLMWAAGKSMVVGLDATGAVKVTAKTSDGQPALLGEGQVSASTSSVWVGGEGGEVIHVDPVTGLAKPVASVTGRASVAAVGDRVWVSEFISDKLESFAAG